MIVDDIVATAGSLVEAVSALKKEGAKQVYAAISHGILSGKAIENLKKCKTLKGAGYYRQYSFRKTKTNS